MDLARTNSYQCVRAKANLPSSPIQEILPNFLNHINEAPIRIWSSNSQVPVNKG